MLFQLRFYTLYSIVPCQAPHLGGSTLSPRPKFIHVAIVLLIPCSIMKVFPPPVYLPLISTFALVRFPLAVQLQHR